MQRTFDVLRAILRCHMPPGSELVTCFHLITVYSESAAAYPAACRRSPMEILRVATSRQYPSPCEATRSTFMAKQLLLLQQNVSKTECTSCSSSEPQVKMHIPSVRSRIATNCQPRPGSNENRIKTMAYQKMLHSYAAYQLIYR